MTGITLLLIIGAGLLTGVVSGLLGVGGGTILIPAVVLILGASQHLAQGVSLAVIIPTALMGAYGYYMRNNVDTEKAWFLAIGAIFGAYLGSFAACSISSYNLKIVFGVFLIVVAVKILKDVLSKQK